MAASSDGTTANETHTLPYSHVDVGYAGYALASGLICIVVCIVFYYMWCLRPDKE